MNKRKITSGLLSLVIISTAAGCSSIRTSNDPRDPMENWNRKVQTFNDNVDKYFMKPVGQGYQWVMPSFADQAVTNFFSNINDIGVTINDLMQLKVAQSGSDGARFIVNSVAGIGGLIDVATMIDLPKHDEDFDQTLGVWGVPTGPYMVIPLFGSSSPRGISGAAGDAAMNPISYLDSGIITSGLFGLNAIDKRADNLTTEKIASEAAVDRYEFFKNAYLQRRKYLVYDGNLPEDEYDLEFDADDENGAPLHPY